MTIKTQALDNQRDPQLDMRAFEDNSGEVAEVIASYEHTILDVAHVGQPRSRAGLSFMKPSTPALETYSIGEGPEARFTISGDGLPEPAAMVLVARSEAGYELRFTAAMKGEVAVGAQSLSLGDLIASGRAQATGDGAYSYLLPSGARAKLAHGEVHFHVNLVKRGALIAKRGKIDWPFWGYFGGTATVAAAFVLLMGSMPDDALALQLDSDDAAARFASYFHQAEQSESLEPVESEPVAAPESPDNSPASSSQGAKGPAGKMGDKGSNNPSGKYKLQGAADAMPQMARHYDPVAAASTAGILGILAAQDQSFIAAVDGGAFNVGNDDRDLWGNVTGTDFAAANGLMGLATFGNGPGGGQAGNMIGLDETGLLGDGPGSNGNYRPPGSNGLAEFGDHHRKVPAPRIGKPNVVGQVDKSMIRRIVRGHINEVRSCYNKALSSNPNLQGRVAVQFSIVGTGKVASSVVVENTTKNSPVADCIAKAVKRWKFPPVRGGGTALVTYPFLLNAR